MSGTQASYLWFDYETTGIDIAHDRIVEYGAQRTDAALNPIGAPIRLRCRLNPDHLPSVHSTQVHGIGPLDQNRSGQAEYDFACAIHDHTSQSGTCNIGYNNYRFDDHFMRHLFYRNLLPPYDFHTRNECSRWDFQEVARAARALSPQGMQWPDYEDGRPCYRLADIAAANGIAADAHDALDDARTTLELARLLHRNSPKFWDWCSRHRLPGSLSVQLLEPMVWVSARLPKQHLCCSLVLPLQESLRGPRGWVLAHLDEGADVLLQRPSLEEMKQLRHDGALPLSQVRANQSPMLFPLSALTDARSERLGIDIAAQRHLGEELIRGASLRNHLLSHFAMLLDDDEAARNARDDTDDSGHADPDGRLYQRGFPSRADQKRLGRLRQLPLDDWLAERTTFDDADYFDQLLNVLGRNRPDLLSEPQWQVWHRRICARIKGGPGRTLADFERELAEAGDDIDERLRGELTAWRDAVLEWMSLAKPPSAHPE
ncbi:MAG: exodeoxyribonuclease I [Gammaproteobacteria bacterium AqS3]|nr:exodeoxyribonuclease I [Gammaproteobacteria bacterium AqS3]